MPPVTDDTQGEADTGGGEGSQPPSEPSEFSSPTAAFDAINQAVNAIRTYGKI
jgi:hypothetical protein